VACLVLGALTAFSPAAASAATRFVAPAGNDAANDCQAEGAPCATIQHAVDEATAGDVVQLAPGTYTENGVAIAESLTLRGAGAGDAAGEELLDPGALTSIVQTTGPGQGPTLTLASPASGPAPEIGVEDVHLVGNDQFDTVRIASTDAGGQVPIESVGFGQVAVTGSRSAINTTGDEPVHGFNLDRSAITCTGASNPTGGVLLGVADGDGGPVQVTDNYLADCGWAINAGDHTGFGATRAVAGEAVIAGNTIEETQFGCVLIALSYEDLTIEDNSLANCDLQPSAFDAAINLQGTLPATHVTVTGNEIGRAAPTTGGNVGVIVQNLAVSPGELARFDVEGNEITGLTATASSTGVRLGPTSISRAAADVDVNVTGNTLAANSRGFDWQTNAGTAVGQNLELRGNRIAGNTARGISLFGPDRTLDAERNWWGCNEGPQVTGAAGPTVDGCDSVGIAVPATSMVDFDPWFVFEIVADPATIFTGGATADVTARVIRDSDGASVPSGLETPGGGPVVFGTDLGTVDPAVRDLGAGVASSTLSSGAAPGIANVSATLDGETVGTTVEIVNPPEPPVDPPDDPGPALPGPTGPTGPTDGDDQIGGTDGDDIIDGLAGDDGLFGGLGDDLLNGGDGADDLRGGQGDDEVRGGAGDDSIRGGAGDDFLRGGPGDDTIVGGGGSDDIGSGSGDDTIDAQDGEADAIKCGPGEDDLDADGRDSYGPNCENVS
jgi:hypothetical protein